MKLFKVVSFVVAILLLVFLPPVSSAKGLPLKSGKLASLTQHWQQLVAGVSLIAIACTGCGAKMVLDKKYEPVLATAAVASFATQIPLGILAAEEKVSPAFPWAVTGVYVATYILARSAEFDYGGEGRHSKRGNVDWYGLRNDLYGDRIYGVRVDGQEQFAAHKQNLDAGDYDGVLVHFRHNGQDYAAKLSEPRRFRYFRRYPRGLNVRIRIPSDSPPPPRPKAYFNSLQPTDAYRVYLDEVLGVFITNHPDYDDDWVVIEDGDRRLFGKVTHTFTSDYAQVRIEAIQEGDKLIDLGEEDVFYDVFPKARIQREEDASEVSASELK